MKIALICGGPSLERGISLNSARSVLDHLEGDGIEVLPLYFDHKKRPYRISRPQLYSNTPSDFDFKLRETAKFLSPTALKNFLKSVDMAFPVIHGQFGEDGGIQRVLERNKVPYTGSDVDACKRCFDKFEANEFIRKRGFFAPPSIVLKIHETNHAEKIRGFFDLYGLKRAIVKPATGGSSIGVFSVSTVEAALEKVKRLFAKRMDTRVVIEPFCTGIEFTVILLQNRFGMPVAILPTEIETDYTEHQIFDFRKKYLPSRHVRYHCPPRFSNEIIEKIQVQAEQLFVLLGMRDFARFDGWLFPDGNLWFSDFNPISGMEQNSFLFQQTSRVGFSHRDLLRFIVKNAARRYGLEIPKMEEIAKKSKKPVNILLGGETSERQVSLMSGTNAWLKLKRSRFYDPKPFLLDIKGQVWELPYALTLNHTVEEVLENCERAEEGEKRLRSLEEKVRLRLALKENETSEMFFIPKKMSLEKFIGKNVKQNAFILIGLHGGMGEDGTLQKKLWMNHIKFNGPGEKTSRICMDKWETGERLQGLEKLGIHIAHKKSEPLAHFERFKVRDFDAYFKELQKELASRTIVVKPQDEGCSSGIVRLFSAQDLQKYIRLALKRSTSIPPNTFRKQLNIVEMPNMTGKRLLFEQFIETDKVRVKGNRLKWRPKKGWVEVTVGVIQKGKKMHALNPSLTVAEGEVLSVEEKFQGGTGINMTPPPEKYVKPSVLARAKKAVEIIAEKLGIEGYCRVDAFLNIDTGDLILIEVNTLPALTPSTVLFHQALAEKRPMYPKQLLEKLIQNKGY